MYFYFVPKIQSYHIIEKRRCIYDVTDMPVNDAWSHMFSIIKDAF